MWTRTSSAVLGLLLASGAGAHDVSLRGAGDPALLAKSGLNMVMPCNKTLDVVLVLDASGSLGSDGWAAVQKFGSNIVESFKPGYGRAKVAVIMYSGPRTYSGVKKCTGKSKKTVDMEKDCRIKTVAHFTDDMKKVQQLILGTTWTKGSTLTSLALMSAKAELSLGRKTAHSVVILVTDGKPLSYRKTLLAAKTLRKAARLVIVPVGEHADLKAAKTWATRRWQENVVVVAKKEGLQDVEVANHLIADICPATLPKLEVASAKDDVDYVKKAEAAAAEKAPEDKIAAADASEKADVEFVEKAPEAAAAEKAPENETAAADASEKAVGAAQVQVAAAAQKADVVEAAADKPLETAKR